MTLLVAVLGLQAQRSSKRGFGEDNLGYIQDLRALAKGCSWWYNWGYTGSSVHDQFLAEGGDIDFVPMTWNGGYDLGRLREFYATHPEAKFLLGFNEPNFKAQSNMTPSQAAEKWPALEQLAEELGLPYSYVRPKPKDHGMGNQVEGEIRKGAKVVVVEDLISTGGSSLKAVEALRQYGVEVIGMVASFTYGFPVAEEAFKEAGVKLITLSNYNAVLEQAAETGYIKKEDLEVLNEWRKSPSTWKQ